MPTLTCTCYPEPHRNRIAAFLPAAASCAPSPAGPSLSHGSYGGDGALLTPDHTDLMRAKHRRQRLLRLACHPSVN
jgi:hypothetical protein